MHSLEYLRRRLDAAGVPEMTGPYALIHLAEYVLKARLITENESRGRSTYTGLP
jgi:hypothetical protein